MIFERRAAAISQYAVVFDTDVVWPAFIAKCISGRPGTTKNSISPRRPWIQTISTPLDAWCAVCWDQWFQKLLAHGLAGPTSCCIPRHGWAPRYKSEERELRGRMDHVQAGMLLPMVSHSPPAWFGLERDKSGVTVQHVLGFQFRVRPQGDFWCDTSDAASILIADVDPSVLNGTRIWPSGRSPH